MSDIIRKEELGLIGEQMHYSLTESDSIEPGKIMSNIIKNEDEPDRLNNQQQILAICTRGDAKEVRIDAENMHLSKKLRNNETVLEKLRNFFDALQRQHPESHLELHCIDDKWKVWCGICKKHLRPDKSGKSLHNIQKQHFSTSKHNKNLQLMLQAEIDKDDIEKIHVEVREHQA